MSVHLSINIFPFPFNKPSWSLEANILPGFFALLLSGRSYKFLAKWIHTAKNCKKNCKWQIEVWSSYGEKVVNINNTSYTLITDVLRFHITCVNARGTRSLTETNGETSLSMTIIIFPNKEDETRKDWPGSRMHKQLIKVKSFNALIFYFIFLPFQRQDCRLVGCLDWCQRQIWSRKWLYEYIPSESLVI